MKLVIQHYMTIQFVSLRGELLFFQWSYNAIYYTPPCRFHVPLELHFV